MRHDVRRRAGLGLVKASVPLEPGGKAKPRNILVQPGKYEVRFPSGQWVPCVVRWRYLIGDIGVIWGKTLELKSVGPSRIRGVDAIGREVLAAWAAERRLGAGDSA